MTKVDWNQLVTSREKILFILVATVMTVLFFRVVSMGQLKQINSYQDRLQALGLEKEALIKFSATTPMLENGATFSKNFGIRAKILSGQVKPAFQNLSSLLTEITDPAFLGGVTIENLSYLPAISDQGYSKTDFTLNIRGNFNDVLRYVDRLEQFPALLLVDNFSLKRGDSQSQDLQVEILGRFFQL